MMKFKRFFSVFLALVVVVCCFLPTMAKPAKAIAVYDDVTIAIVLVLCGFCGVEFVTHEAGVEAVGRFLDHIGERVTVITDFAATYAKEGILYVTKALYELFQTFSAEIVSFFHVNDGGFISYQISANTLPYLVFENSEELESLWKAQAWDTVVEKYGDYMWHPSADKIYYIPSGLYGGQYLRFQGDNTYAYCTYNNYYDALYRVDAVNDWSGITNTYYGFLLWTTKDRIAEGGSGGILYSSPGLKTCFNAYLAFCTKTLDDGSKEYFTGLNEVYKESTVVVSPSVTVSVSEGILAGAPDVFPGDKDENGDDVTIPWINLGPYIGGITDTDTGTITVPGAGTLTDTVTDAIANPSQVVDTDVLVPVEGVTWQNVFPFCIPFDLIRFLNVLDADPEAPCIEWPFNVPGIYEGSIVIDLSVFDTVSQILRNMELLAFCIGLILLTRNIIRG